MGAEHWYSSLEVSGTSQTSCHCHLLDMSQLTSLSPPGHVPADFSVTSWTCPSWPLCHLLDMSQLTSLSPPGHVPADFSVTSWKCPSRLLCHLLDMSQPTSQHSQHSFHCSTDEQHWWLKASFFSSGGYLIFTFCWHISVSLNFRSSSLLPAHTVLSQSLCFVFVTLETNCHSDKWKFSSWHTWLVPVTDVQGQPNFGFMWWVDILHGFCDTLVQAYPTVDMCGVCWNVSFLVWSTWSLKRGLIASLELLSPSSSTSYLAWRQKGAYCFKSTTTNNSNDWKNSV